MAAVGATNVGSIKVYNDKVRCYRINYNHMVDFFSLSFQKLLTNLPEHERDGEYFDEPFHNENLSGIPMKRGDPFGEFNLGSTIVLIFEAPSDLKFHVPEGRKIRFGQRLATRL